jgi:hypothetical protein
MLAAVTRLNRQITRLASVLNTPTLREGLRVTTEPSTVPVAAMVKRASGVLHVFAVAMRETATTATFTLPDLKGRHAIEVLEENRSLTVSDGVFQDRFEPWDVHLYRLKPAQAP